MAVADIGLAVNDRRKNQNGEWIEETTFVDVTLWGRTAEVAGEYLSKGSPLLIEGRLKYDTWEKDGQKRSKLQRRLRADANGRRARVAVEVAVVEAAAAAGKIRTYDDGGDYGDAPARPAALAAAASAAPLLRRRRRRPKTKFRF